MTQTAYEGWALIELMGHRTRVGKVSEAEIYGGKLIRIDIPINDLNGEFVTEYYGCGSIYSLRPISEDLASEYAKRNGDPRPVKPCDYKPQTPHSPEEIEDQSANFDNHPYD